ncbi:hypothetical protein DPMN_138623 [Dreissena polymorpha]|uniref:Nuclease HARBI1 n=1 Tax=Dreissena polymorpha TaxID=45954 RepID=A0A9D4G4A2_DREPO|nr:hypothetical protein DPMN_138623 [Dreissena polymorpha]
MRAGWLAGWLAGGLVGGRNKFVRAITMSFILNRSTKRSLSVPIALAVCTYLRYVAIGDLQLTVDSTGLSQATVSRVCAQVSDILAAKVPEFVKFPAGADAALAKQELEQVPSLEQLNRSTKRSLSVPVALAVCIYLRYVASGDLQLTVGDSTGLSQAMVSRVCAQVSDILAAKVLKFVKFPAGADAALAKQELGAIAELNRSTKRSLSVPVALAVCTYLRYVASGDLQLTIGDSTGLSQATVSRVCAHVSDILAAKVLKFVEFSAGADAALAKQEFGAIAAEEVLYDSQGTFDNCEVYPTVQKVKDIPCGGCPYCTRADQQWGQFIEEVDDAVPLATGGLTVEAATEAEDITAKNCVLTTGEDATVEEHENAALNGD